MGEVSYAQNSYRRIGKHIESITQWLHSSDKSDRHLDSFAGCKRSSCSHALLPVGGAMHCRGSSVIALFQPRTVQFYTSKTPFALDRLRQAIYTGGACTEALSIVKLTKVSLSLSSADASCKMLEATALAALSRPPDASAGHLSKVSAALTSAACMKRGALITCQCPVRNVASIPASNATKLDVKRLPPG